MTFPATPSDGDLHQEGGRAWRYAASINAWEEVPNLFGAVTAPEIPYDPATTENWTTDPENVGAALDELAARESGGGGGGQVLHDQVALVSYTGKAAVGVLPATESWTIVRTTFAADGSVSASVSATAVAWDDRLTATYS